VAFTGVVLQVPVIFDESDSRHSTLHFSLTRINRNQIYHEDAKARRNA
jgi:hypothetical protein